MPKKSKSIEDEVIDGDMDIEEYIRFRGEMVKMIDDFFKEEKKMYKPKEQPKPVPGKPKPGDKK